MTQTLLKPALYQAGDPPALPSLSGMRCNACGYVFFPAQQYGCEQCGATADALATQSLAGSGVLQARVTVHRHFQPEPPVPFVMSIVRLDDGPVLHALLDVAPEQLPEIGSQVVARLVPLGDPESSKTKFDLRFAPKTQPQAQE